MAFSFFASCVGTEGASLLGVFCMGRFIPCFFCLTSRLFEKSLSRMTVGVVAFCRLRRANSQCSRGREDEFAICFFSSFVALVPVGSFWR